AYLALERASERRATIVLALATFLAPFCHGVGLALGPALVVEVAWVRAPKKRLLAATLAPWLAALAVYMAVGATGGTRLPRTAADAHAFLACFEQGIGVGLVEKGFLLPGLPPLASTLGYFALVGLGVSFLARDERRIVLARHVLLLFVIGSVVVAR